METKPNKFPYLDAHKVAQSFKLLLYLLLLANFGYYLFEDLVRARHTLTDTSTLLDWTENFTTTIDEIGWFALLLIYELETYLLDDVDWSGWVANILSVVKVFCFVMIGHTLVANTNALIDIYGAALATDTNDLCDFANQDLSWVFNLEYTSITAETCKILPTSDAYFFVPEEPVVTTFSGLQLQRELTWFDLIESSAWLFVVIAIELSVRITDRGITSGVLVSSLNWLKVVLYLLILGIGFYWAWLGHWVYLWDEILWIGGFAILEMNLDTWRTEINEKLDAGGF